MGIRFGELENMKEFDSQNTGELKMIRENVSWEKRGIPKIGCRLIVN